MRYGSAAGRWVLLAAVLGSGMALLDATVVNVALPTIGRDFDAQLSSLQWTVNAYTLTLAGFLLLGGSLADHYGRRRVFIIGVIWFALGSLLCGLAPSAGTLISARAFQGVGAALLTPGSLAIIQASFEPEGRGAAVGAWSGLGGVAAAVGPLLGGWLVYDVSWRLIFLINLPVAAVVVWVAARHVPESCDRRVREARIDVWGAALVALALAALTYALTQAQGGNFGSPKVLFLGGAALLALAGFVIRERLTDHPMVPLDLFSSRQFSAANLVTFLVYAALAAGLFLLPIELQQVAGYSPLSAGSALIPLTVIMLFLSARAGALAARIGPRLPMSIGPLVAGLGLLLLTRLDAQASYATDVLPAVVVLGLGLSLTVAPLTATVLAAGGEEHVGVSSAVNNEVARVAGLIAVAAVPLAVGLSGSDYRRPAAFDNGFDNGVILAGLLCLAGGLLAFVTIRRSAGPGDEAQTAASCPLSAPPLRHGRPAVAASADR